MKKFMTGIVLGSLLLAGTAPSYTPVEAASVFNKGSFTDDKLYKYANDENFKVEKSVMYFKNERGDFVKPSTKYIKNSTLMNVTKGFLDKDRYTYVSYERRHGIDKVYITYSTTYAAALFGNDPISYQFNTNKKAKTESASNVRISLSLEYDFYDSITNKFNSSIYQTKLKYSLIEIFGKKEGEAIYKHVNALRKKYNKVKIDPSKPIESYKKIGKIGIYSSMDSNQMYVDFSY